MSIPTKQNIKIYQGSTFREVVRWEDSEKTYAPITAITKSAPLVVTSVAHSIPKGWRVRFTDIVGMTNLNSTEDYHVVSSVDTNTITINSINSLSYKDYISGGVIEYNTPVDLAGYTARMQIRAKVDSTDFLEELTTEDGYISLDNINKSITITIPPNLTALYTFSSAVYSLEMISAAGAVTTLLVGSVSLVKEVTR